jgi:hypothetical protein
MDVESWRAFTKPEMREYLEELRKRTGNTDRGPHYKTVLAVRQQLSPVDMFCYLKARFGEPNGVQNILRSDSSDNWIHWEYSLKADGEDISIGGTYREVHFMLTEELADADWPALLKKIKMDFGRMGREKSEVLRSLEKWVIFPNKFVAVSNVCAELHAEIVKASKALQPGAFPRHTSNAIDQTQTQHYQKLATRMFDLYRNCLELSLLTPVLAEAFLNMAIVILCKKEVRENARQYDAFLRSQIDPKIFDLPYKCQGFRKRIDPDSDKYKKFKRVMDKRNHAIHGNIDPEREQIEVVYFEGRRPLFKEQGDHIAKRLDAQVRQYEPEVVIQDYEDTHLFLVSITDYLGPKLRKDFWHLMEDPYPGYDSARKIAGGLLPETTSIGHLQGVRYDDELAVSWE